MPHKHKRKFGEQAADINLPPTAIARSLPSFQNDVKLSNKGKGQQREKTKLREVARLKQRKIENKPSNMLQDDTPRAFKRLMMIHKSGRIPDGLDDGNYSRKKKAKNGSKQSEEGKAAVKPIKEKEAENGTPAQSLKVLPGERLTDFYARVDRSMPLSEISSKGKKIVVDGKEIRENRETRHNKNLRRKQDNWRKEDEAYKQKLEEEEERLEEELDERRELYGEEVMKFEQQQRRGHAKVVGEVDDDDDDPWAVLNAKREAPKGLHDVAKAPPKFEKIPKEKFKVKNGAKVVVNDIPKSAGSLRRREELGETRNSIIESYRRMMRENKP